MTTIITLLALGILLLLIEIVVPGGVIGVIGILLIISGVVLGAMENAWLGLGLLSGVVVFGFFAFLAWVKFFPKTPVGKKMFLDKDAKDWQSYEDSNKKLIGLTGISHTDLRPSGLVIIDGKRIDVITEGELIDKGESVKVTKVEGNRIVVESDELSKK